MKESLKGKAEDWIRGNATNWMMIGDVEDYTGIDPRYIYLAVKSLDECGAIEVAKEGRFLKFRLKYWFQRMYGMEESE
jgi:predicted transcriptional regulator of viral defense system